MNLLLKGVFRFYKSLGFLYLKSADFQVMQKLNSNIRKMDQNFYYFIELSVTVLKSFPSV